MNLISIHQVYSHYIASEISKLWVKLPFLTTIHGYRRSHCLHGWSCTSGDDELISSACVKGHLPVQDLRAQRGTAAWEIPAWPIGLPIKNNDFPQLCKRLPGGSGFSNIPDLG